MNGSSGGAGVGLCCETGDAAGGRRMCISSCRARVDLGRGEVPVHVALVYSGQL